MSWSVFCGKFLTSEAQSRAEDGQVYRQMLALPPLAESGDSGPPPGVDLVLGSQKATQRNIHVKDVIAFSLKIVENQ